MLCIWGFCVCIFKNFGKAYIIKFTILTIFRLQLSDIECIHIVVQPSLLPIPRKKSWFCDKVFVNKVLLEHSYSHLFMCCKWLTLWWKGQVEGSWEWTETVWLLSQNYSILTYRKWASLVAQIVKNLPTRQETQVWSWVGKIPWRK